MLLRDARYEDYPSVELAGVSFPFLEESVWSENQAQPTVWSIGLDVGGEAPAVPVWVPGGGCVKAPAAGPSEPFRHDRSVLKLGLFIGWAELHHGLVEGEFSDALVPIDLAGGTAAEERKQCQQV